MKNFYSIVLILSLFACQGNETIKDEQNKKVTDSKSVNEHELVPDKINSELDGRELLEDEIREFGKIIKIEDSPYPRFIVTVDFPKRNKQVTYNLNIEEIELDVEGLMKLKNKFATIFYTSDASMALMDLHFEGKSLLGKYAPESLDNLDEIIGTLSGAEFESVGDLPDEIFITNEEGQMFSFDYFIPSEFLVANNKSVHAFYHNRYDSNITYLKGSESH